MRRLKLNGSARNKGIHRATANPTEQAAEGEVATRSDVDAFRGCPAMPRQVSATFSEGLSR
jgi:hypothetical protein